MTTKDSGPSKDVNTTILSDDDFDPDKEEMTLLDKRCIRFFRKRKPFSNGIGRESSNTKSSKYIKIDEELKR